MKHDYETYYTQALVIASRMDFLRNREKDEGDITIYKQVAKEFADRMTKPDSVAVSCMWAGADNLPNVANEELV